MEFERQPLSDATNTNRHSSSDGSDKSMVRFNKLVVKAKEYASKGDVAKALALNQEAIKLFPSDKLAKRIAKMEAYLAEFGEDNSEDSDMTHVGEGFYLYKDLYDKLYPHQKDGVLWLWKLNKKKRGGILGDDMGLGKTIQVIAFLSGMFDAEQCKTVLLVLPVAVMLNWEKEFEKWSPGLRLTSYHGASKKERERSLAKVQRRGGVCMTSYGMIVTSFKQLSEKDGREFVWDYVILDEGHKIKNPSNKSSKGLHQIPAHNRIILTGTAIQNNLKELWALFDFVQHGRLLGTQRTFAMEYEHPITRARESCSTVGEKRLGEEMAESLRQIIAPFFLRRTKMEVKEQAKKREKNKEAVPTDDKILEMPELTRKNDLICWVYLSEPQQQIYTDFISTERVQEMLMSSKSPLVALNVLKKICDHPRLLSTQACNQLGLDGEEGMDDEMPESMSQECAANRINHIPDDVLLHESGKLEFTSQLVDQLKSEGHRCLIFSQSRKMLDIVQRVLSNRGHKIIRLDGTIKHLEDREKRINKFQSDSSYTVFLLTTQVGGVGLTLTAANRVIIIDPSWNPATDNQAVDRAFRIGQDKNVVIYRLITCGTIEEKIYRRQVFKDSITRQTTGGAKNPHRYFTKMELRELFSLGDPKRSSTQEQLNALHETERKTDTTLDAHIAYLHTLPMYGVSDHDLMFSKEVQQEDSDNEDLTAGTDYIQARVQKAQDLISRESELNEGQGSESSRVPDRPRPGGSGGVGVSEWRPPKPQSPEVDLTNETLDNDTDNSIEEVSTEHDESGDHDEETEELNKDVVAQEEEMNNTAANLTMEDIEQGEDAEGDMDKEYQTQLAKALAMSEQQYQHDQLNKFENLANDSTANERSIQDTSASDSPLPHHFTPHHKTQNHLATPGSDLPHTPGSALPHSPGSALPNIPKSAVLSHTPVSSKHHQKDTITPNIVQEDILISPDPTRPLVSTTPHAEDCKMAKQLFPENTENPNEAKESDTSAIEEYHMADEDIDMNESEDHNMDSENDNGSDMVNEQPKTMDDLRHIVEDHKMNAEKDRDWLSSSIVMDSTENTPVKSSKPPRRKSLCCSRNFGEVIKNSDDESEESESVNEADDFINDDVEVDDEDDSMDSFIDDGSMEDGAVSEQEVSYDKSRSSSTPKTSRSKGARIIESSEDEEVNDEINVTNENEAADDDNEADMEQNDVSYDKSRSSSTPKTSRSKGARIIESSEDEEVNDEINVTNENEAADDDNEADMEQNDVEEEDEENEEIDEEEEEEEEEEGDDSDDEEDSFCALPEEHKELYNELISKGRECYAEKNPKGAYKCFLQALKIYANDEKLQSTVLQLREKLKKLKAAESQ
ncbi:unnamed protein product [Owenia fusiformis]|uniref:DNA excision repair protein ERCC-6-like n=1 Tax=Owenia fusiformis TaxID=6347 RepID=A0A8S4Q771_OWEFU|nr:unnamed protein product [Owenia fusiformis]